MNINAIWRTVKVFTVANAETILSVAATGGVIATAITSFKAANKLQKAKKDLPEDATFKEKVKATGKYYIPPVLAVGMTMTCIFSANKISLAKRTNLATSYAFTRTLLEQYRNGVALAVGKETEEKLFEEANTATNLYYAHPHAYVCTAPECKNGNIRFVEPYGHKVFYSNLAFVEQARYHLNRNFALRGYASLNEFYEFLGEEPIPIGEDEGWSWPVLAEYSDMCPWIDMSFIPKIDEKTCEEYYEIQFIYNPETLELVEDC